MKNSTQNSKNLETNEEPNEKSSSYELAESIPPRPSTKHTLRKPLPGFTYNPLKSYPRNNPCPCLSGKKFKVCHLNKLPEVIPQKDAESYSRLLKLTKNIKFVTKDNQEELMPTDGVQDSNPTTS